MSATAKAPLARNFSDHGFSLDDRLAFASSEASYIPRRPAVYCRLDHGTGVLASQKTSSEHISSSENEAESVKNTEVCSDPPSSDHQHQNFRELWLKILDRLSPRIQPHNMEMWLAPLDPIHCQPIAPQESQRNDKEVNIGYSVNLSAPNAYIRDWFNDHYRATIIEELRLLGIPNASIDVRITEVPPKDDNLNRQPLHNAQLISSISTAKTTNTRIATNSGTSILNASASNDSLGKNADQASLSATQRPFPNNIKNKTTNLSPKRYSFEGFVVGPSNQLAYAATQAVASLPGARYNPLFIYGGVGLGKTHLLLSTAKHLLSNRPELNIEVLSAEEFMNCYIEHLRTNRMEQFRERFRRQCDALLMDDIQFIAGKERTQDEFFHTFNSLHDAGKQIMVTCDKYPHEIPDIEDRLRTRFQWGLVADIQSPSFETRLAILKQKVYDEDLQITSDVLTKIASTQYSSVRELEGILLRISACRSLSDSPTGNVDLDRVLSSVGVPVNIKPTIERIQALVGQHFNLSVDVLCGKKRTRSIAKPRQLAMYLCRELTQSSYPEIGRKFGGKDHSTVMNACKRIRVGISTDTQLSNLVQLLTERLVA